MPRKHGGTDHPENIRLLGVINYIIAEVIAKCWKVTVAVLAICGAVIVYAANFFSAQDRLMTLFESSALYDYAREAPAIGRAQILVANVQYDDTGRYTAEIRETLRRDGKPYRMLKREHDDEDTEGNLEHLAALLNRHRAVLLLEGAVSGKL